MILNPKTPGIYVSLLEKHLVIPMPFPDSSGFSFKSLPDLLQPLASAAASSYQKPPEAPTTGKWDMQHGIDVRMLFYTCCFAPHG